MTETVRKVTDDARTPVLRENMHGRTLNHSQAREKIAILHKERLPKDITHDQFLHQWSNLLQVLYALPASEPIRNPPGVIEWISVEPQNLLLSVLHAYLNTYSTEQAYRNALRSIPDVLGVKELVLKLLNAERHRKAVEQYKKLFTSTSLAELRSQVDSYINLFIEKTSVISITDDLGQAKLVERPLTMMEILLLAIDDIIINGTANGRVSISQIESVVAKKMSGDKAISGLLVRLSTQENWQKKE